MIHKLLFRQLYQELQAAAQLSYLAGIIKNSEIKALLLEFAKEELEHFSVVANILFEMGHKSTMKPLELKLEPDELKCLIVLEAIEDTLIRYYEEMLPILKEPFKSRIRSQLTQEIDHKAKMELLLKKAKENIKRRSKADRPLLDHYLEGL